MKPFETIDAYLKDRNIRIGPPRKEQTDGGTHSPTSVHRLGRARDYGDFDSDCSAIVKALLPLAGPGGPIMELFYTPTRTFWDNGLKIVPRPSDYIWYGHKDHVHVALWPGRTLATGTPVPVHSETPPILTESDPEMNESARTVRWATAVLVARPDGGTERYGALDEMGNMTHLLPEEKKDFGEITAANWVDPNRPSAGYVLYSKKGNGYTFDEAKARELRAKGLL